MFAEIYKKIPKKWRRMEDVLTGTFFGIIRYTQLNGLVLNKLLSRTQFSTESKQNKVTKEFANHLKSIENSSININFWKRFGHDEIDLILEYEDFVIGIEIKYNSGFHDSKDEEGEWLGQLQKYGRLIKEHYPYKKQYLIILGKQNNAQRLYKERENYIKEDFGKNFGYVTWEVFHKELQIIKNNLKNSNKGWLKIILDDLIYYLDLKGLGGFYRFDLEYFENLNIDLNLKYEF